VSAPTVDTTVPTQRAVTSARSMPAVLFALAEACTSRGLPVPDQVSAFRGNEIVTLAFRDRAAFDRWLTELGVPFSSSQRCEEDGVAMVLRTASADWLGWWVALQCKTPAVVETGCL
jgi:hypothetical protein